MSMENESWDFWGWAVFRNQLLIVRLSLSKSLSSWHLTLILTSYVFWLWHPTLTLTSYFDSWKGKLLQILNSRRLISWGEFWRLYIFYVACKRQRGRKLQVLHLWHLFYFRGAQGVAADFNEDSPLPSGECAEEEDGERALHSYFSIALNFSIALILLYCTPSLYCTLLHCTVLHSLLAVAQLQRLA